MVMARSSSNSWLSSRAEDRASAAPESDLKVEGDIA